LPTHQYFTFRDVAILHQRGRIFRRSRAEIQAEEWFRAHLPRPGNEFVGAELIRFESVPSAVQYGGAVLPRAHAVKPVIAGDKISAGIANDGDAKIADFFHDIGTKTIAVGELRTWIVNALINCPPEVLQKRSEEMRADRSNRAIRIDDDACGALALGDGESAQRRSGGNSQGGLAYIL
jgi:hypothetical protein